MDLRKIFQNQRPIIGMIHLAGKINNVVERALEELRLYEEEGVDGAIIEDYHGNEDDIESVLKASNSPNFKIVRGVNVLANPYSSFNLAQKYGARFIQFDSVQSNNLDTKLYERLREHYPEIVVFGGIRFKYIMPTGKSLEEDIDFGIRHCDAIVTTGEGTGIETPLQKLKDFKSVLRNFPLVVGAGVNINNVYHQLKIADGAIVGSYFKNGDTQRKIIRENVKGLMEIVHKIKK